MSPTLCFGCFFMQSDMKSQAYQLAQNKIDYIVFHNPKKVSELLYNQGFEPPKDAISLSEAIKELSRKKGQPFIAQLLKLHPDSKAILSIHTTKASKSCIACSEDSFISERNYCSSCGHSNYNGSGDEDSFLGQFESYKEDDLKKYYKNIVLKSNQYPKDEKLAQEVQMIWNEIRERKEKQKKEPVAEESSKNKFISRDDLLLIAIVFAAGVLVGHGLKFNINNGK